MNLKSFVKQLVEPGTHRLLPSRYPILVSSEFAVAEEISGSAPAHKTTTIETTVKRPDASSETKDLCAIDR
jgi:hypothetical protein